jgi:ABC-2 type transport system permease protein
MLWHKAWLETRMRFLIALVGLAGFCAIYVLFHKRFMMPQARGSYALYLWFINRLTVNMWELAVILLSMGGLMRERSQGSAVFTLSLPASRLRLVSVRAAVGALQAIALAALPWLVILLLSPMAGERFPAGQAAYYVLLMAGGGMVYFAMGLLLSTIFEGDYSVPVMAFGGLVVYTLVTSSFPALRPYNLNAMMNGTTLLSKETYFLTAPIPWTGILASLSVALAMYWAAVKITERRDF